MRDIHGIHHTGLLTRDLDGLERAYTSFGFTLSHRSRHLLGGRPGEAPVPGCTANRCALFGGSYIELLGIVDESAPDPWHTKAMADEYEGFRLLNLDTDDAEAADRRLAGAGLRTSGVLELERDIDTEQGPRTVRARAVHIDPRSTPEGYVGIAQHLTRAYVHQPRYLGHPNGARGLAAVLMVADDAEFDAITDRYAAMLRTAPGHRGPVAVLDATTAVLEIVRASDVEEVLPGEPAPASSYLAAMTVVVDDVDRARKTVESGGTPTRTAGDGFFVSARHAYGAGLFFTAG
ncbi:VOC family protein [Streptomyces sp. NBS 14/10]|uniref:VOC family protein n=1 Tax=Streptomyces sp. NBS 14/10 TaxID=1945643 RepID=UPI001C532113|nr:VOC family protein [Streptomyces sp. NBS 14/10]KAK1177573.1 VOC family protein [Streptomyces sp. NBS 14/10]